MLKKTLCGFLENASNCSLSEWLLLEHSLPVAFFLLVDNFYLEKFLKLLRLLLEYVDRGLCRDDGSVSPGGIFLVSFF